MKNSHDSFWVESGPSRNKFAFEKFLGFLVFCNKGDASIFGANDGAEHGLGRNLGTVKAI